MAYLDYSGLSYFKNKLEEKFDSTYVKTINSEAADEHGNININKVAFADNLVSDDAQASVGTYVTRTTGGDASISDGEAWLNNVQGNMIREGYSERVIQMETDIADTIPRSGTISASTNLATLKAAVQGSVQLIFEYSTSWSDNPATYGVTVSGSPVFGDKIIVNYTEETLDVTVASAEETPITAAVNRNTFIAAVSGDTEIVFTYNGEEWSNSLSTYGVTVTGTPVAGDSITVTYVEEQLETIVQAVTEVQRQNILVPVISEPSFDNAVSYNGVYNFVWNGTAWDLTFTDGEHDSTSTVADISAYGISTSGSAIENDEITVTCSKEIRGTISIFNPEEFYSTGWNIFSPTLGYARTLKYSNQYGFYVGGTFDTTNVTFSETNDPNAEKTPIELTLVKEGMWYFEVETDGFVWLEDADPTNTYVMMTWSDWQNGPPEGFAPHTASTVNFTDIMQAYFPYGLMKVGAIADEINLSLLTAYSRITRIEYSVSNLADVIATGRGYIYDQNYIYVVKETADSYSIAIDGTFIANDHGLEVFTNTFIPGYAETLYGQNLKDKLRTDVVTISSMNLINSQKASVRNNINAAENVNMGGASAADFYTATGLVAGKAGLVPAPPGPHYALRGDGAWKPAMILHSTLPAGTDFNNVTIYGMFRIDTAANAATMLNNPTGGTGILEVLPGYASSRPRQIWYDAGYSGTWWMRRKTSSTGWGAWTAYKSDGNYLHLTEADNITGGKYFQGTISIMNDNASPKVHFRGLQQELSTGVIYYYGTGNSTVNKYLQGRFSFLEYSPAAGGSSRTSYAEQYFLPKVDAGLTKTVNYNIITTKNLSDITGFVKTSGAETIAGDKTFSSGKIALTTTRYGYLYFRNAAGNTFGTIRCDQLSTTNITNGQFLFYEYSGKATPATTSTGFYETYALPAATSGLTANKSYNILTSKTDVTIGQGGTGMSSVLLESGKTAAADIAAIATAQTGSTIDEAGYAQWGKVAMLYLKITRSSATAEGTAVNVATVVSGRRPALSATGTCYSGSTIHDARVTTAGAVGVHGKIEANTIIYIYSTYLLP